MTLPFVATWIYPLQSCALAILSA